MSDKWERPAVCRRRHGRTMATMRVPGACSQERWETGQIQEKGNRQCHYIPVAYWMMVQLLPHNFPLRGRAYLYFSSEANNKL
jgi:hypothetical protein